MTRPEKYQKRCYHCDKSFSTSDPAQLYCAKCAERQQAQWLADVASGKRSIEDVEPD